VFEGILIRLLVFGAKFLIPIAAVQGVCCYGNLLRGNRCPNQP
jgi:hypothetical protein